MKRLLLIPLVLFLSCEDKQEDTTPIDSSEICNNEYSNIDGSLLSCDEDCFESANDCYHLNDLNVLEVFKQSFDSMDDLALLEIGNQGWIYGRLTALDLSLIGISHNCIPIDFIPITNKPSILPLNEKLPLIYASLVLTSIIRESIEYV